PAGCPAPGPTTAIATPPSSTPAGRGPRRCGSKPNGAASTAGGSWPTSRCATASRPWACRYPATLNDRIVIEIIGLTKAFRGRRAVDDVSAEFPSGAVTALLGLNGAGKTTLLRLIAGLDRPDAGTIRIHARPSGGDPRLVGFHLGPDAMDPRHTVARHLRWLAALNGVDTGRVDAVLADTGLTERRRDR